MTKNPQKIKQKRWQLTILCFLALLLAVSSALPAYIESNFLEQFVNLQTVSVFFIIANAVSVLSILFFPSLIKRLTNYFMTKVILVIYAVALLSFSLTNSPLTAFISVLLLTVAANLIWINLDVLIEKFSDQAITGRIRTVYFTFINLGWIISPALSGYLIKIGTYYLVFFIAAILVLPIFLIMLYQGRAMRDRVKYQPENIHLAGLKMWHNKDLRGILFVAFLLQLFYSAAVLYVPIYLHQNLNMSWNVLGPIFSLMLVPFLLFEIPAGIIADKYIGEKELLTAGLIILTISLFLFFYIKTSTAWLWALVLFFSRSGAALVESMREAYFFKRASLKEVSYLNIFRATAPLAYVISSGLAILILFFWPLNYFFLCLALIMLSGFAFIATIKDTK